MLALSTLKEAYRIGGCCSTFDNYNPCSILRLDSGPANGFTCEDAKSLLCDSLEYETCDECYGIPSHPVCVNATDSFHTPALFAGHSFFIPVARLLPEWLDSNEHTQTEFFRGGVRGSPPFLWENDASRESIQQLIREKKYDLFGISAYRAEDSTGNDEGGLYYRKWFDYAKEYNENMKFMIGVPWFDFPSSYGDQEYYDMIYSTLDNMTSIVMPLKTLYNDVLTVPYNLAAAELRMQRHTFSHALIGPRDTSIFRDEKGHGGTMLLDMCALLWIYGLYKIKIFPDKYPQSFHSILERIYQIFDSRSL